MGWRRAVGQYKHLKCLSICDLVSNKKLGVFLFYVTVTFEEVKGLRRVPAPTFNCEHNLSFMVMKSKDQGAIGCRLIVATWESQQEKSFMVWWEQNKAFCIIKVNKLSD